MPAVASAVLTSSSAETNSFTAGSLATPAGVQTIHPTVTGAGDGDVRLTWTDTIARAITYLVQRAPVASPTAWATVNGLGSGSSSATLCTGSVPGAVSCSYDDNAANSTSAPSYNASYVYQVVAKVGGWTAPSSGRYAGSLPPASGSETYLVPPDLNAVSLDATAGVWAVGANCTVDYYNGTTWTLQNVPTSVCPTGTSLYGVDANVGAPLVVGAGGLMFKCTGACTTAGATWAAIPTGTTQTLYSISTWPTKPQVWAAGANCTALVFDGTGWATQPPPAACAAGTTLYGVDSNGGKPIFAGSNATVFTCTGSCNATAPAWTANPTGAPAGTTFYGVSAQGNAWAVGTGGVVVVCTGTCNNTGATWTTQTSGTSATLRSVFASSTSLVEAVGDSGTVLKCTVNCNKATGTWVPQVSNTTATLNGVALSGTAALAVGRIGTITALGGWAPMATGVTADLKAISGASATSVWAVGANCTVLHYDGSAWFQQTVSAGVCPAGTTLNGVDGTTSRPMFVGDNGVSFYCSANCATTSPTWTSLSTAAFGSPTLYAVSAGANNKMWAVGVSCTVLYFNGTAWASQTPSTALCPAATTLLAVHENGLHPVVGGTGAALLTCSGGGCAGTGPVWNVNTPSGLSGSPTFYGISVATDVWAVGSGGTVALCTGGCGGGGATWTTQTSSTSVTLRGVSAVSTTLVDAVGDSGTIRQCTTSCDTAAGTWPAQESGTTTTLNGVYLVDAANAYVVGSGGAAYGLGTSAFAVVVNTSLPVNVPTTYALVSGDLTQLSSPDSVRYATHGKWPASALPASCTSTTPGVIVRPTSNVPAGTWPLNKAVATVMMRTGSVPSADAGFRLLVSPDNGSSWTSYPLTTPNAANVSTLTSVDITTTLGSTSALATTQLCLAGSSGTGPLLTSAVDVLHLDVN
jgi:hypothetical protein